MCAFQPLYMIHPVNYDSCCCFLTGYLGSVLILNNIVVLKNKKQQEATYDLTTSACSFIQVWGHFWFSDTGYGDPTHLVPFWPLISLWYNKFSRIKTQGLFPSWHVLCFQGSPTMLCLAALHGMVALVGSEADVMQVKRKKEIWMCT